MTDEAYTLLAVFYPNGTLRRFVIPASDLYGLGRFWNALCDDNASAYNTRKMTCEQKYLYIYAALALSDQDNEWSKLKVDDFKERPAFHRNLLNWELRAVVDRFPLSMALIGAWLKYERDSEAIDALNPEGVTQIIHLHANAHPVWNRKRE